MLWVRHCGFPSRRCGFPFGRCASSTCASTGSWLRRRGAPRYVDRSLGTSRMSASVCQQVVGYVDKERLGTTTRNASVRRQGATVRVSLRLGVAVRQHEVEYELHYGWYTSTPSIVRSQCEIAQVLRSDVNFPSVTKEFTWSIYSGLIPLIYQSIDSSSTTYATHTHWTRSGFPILFDYFECSSKS